MVLHAMHYFGDFGDNGKYVEYKHFTLYLQVELTATHCCQEETTFQAPLIVQITPFPSISLR